MHTLWQKCLSNKKAYWCTRHNNFRYIIHPWIYTSYTNNSACCILRVAYCMTIILLINAACALSSACIKCMSSACIKFMYQVHLSITSIKYMKWVVVYKSINTKCAWFYHYVSQQKKVKRCFKIILLCNTCRN